MDFSIIIGVFLIIHIHGCGILANEADDKYPPY